MADDVTDEVLGSHLAVPAAERADIDIAQVRAVHDAIARPARSASGVSCQ